MCRSVLVPLASTLIGSTLRADWHVMVVGGPGYDHVTINALDGTTAVGQAHRLASPAGYFPATWDANNPVTTVFGSLQGRIVGASEGRYVGSLFSSGGAVLWQGTPENWIDLTPAGTQGATAYGMCGDQQVGLTVSAGSIALAALWRGSAASWVDLAPAGTTQSIAYASDGTLQGGVVQYIGGTDRAALWNGTAASLTLLGPADHDSIVRSMVPGQQVGFLGGTTTGGNIHAALWRGTPESFVDLNPPGYGLSDLFGTCGSAQVGYANSSGFGVGPGIWFGTAASFELLPVPSGYSQGVATCISHVDGLYYIGGHAISSTTGEQVALLWVGVPAPGACAPLMLVGLAAPRRRRSSATA